MKFGILLRGGPQTPTIMSKTSLTPTRNQERPPRLLGGRSGDTALVSGLYTESNLEKLQCYTALMTNNSALPENCLNPFAKEIFQIQQYPFFFQDKSAMIVKIASENSAIIFICPSTSEIIHCHGILIVAISKHCTIKEAGSTLRVGDEITELDLSEDVVGIHILYNEKIKSEVGQLTSMVDKITNLENYIRNLQEKYNMEREQMKKIEIGIQNLKEKEYVWGPCIDVLLGALTASCPLFAAIYKIYFYSKRTRAESSKPVKSENSL